MSRNLGRESTKLQAGPKVLMVSNTDWYLYNFRLPLARALRDAGFEVVMVSPRGKYHHRFADAGFRYEPVDFDNRTSSPLKNLRLVRDLLRLYRRERPRVIHHFTIKCVIFGSLANAITRVPVVNAVTGLGHIFSDPRLKTTIKRSIVKRLYRFVLNRRRTRVVFQNQSNLEFFIGSGLVKPDRVDLIRGSGADLAVFRPAPEPRAVCRRPGRCVVLFASRLLWEKGLAELIEAVGRLRGEGLCFDLLIAGETYPTNPSSLTAGDLEGIRLSGVAELLGHVDDMASLLRRVDLVVLPSYHEGTPKILLEAGASGLPLIATDIPGCQGVVVPGRNGFLVPPKDPNALAEALRDLIVDANMRRAYGLESRRVIEEGFCTDRVNSATLRVYAKLLRDRMPKSGADVSEPDQGVDATASTNNVVVRVTEPLRPAASHPEPHVEPVKG